MLLAYREFKVKDESDNYVLLTLMTSSKYPTSSSDVTGVYGLITRLPSTFALRYMWLPLKVE